MLTLPENMSSPLSIRAKAMVFEDPAARELLARIQRIAPSDAPVLVTGETGTGKELVARQLHALSHREHLPFVAVNAGAFSETLIESELFGHERGAFTGAHSAKAGWFEAANGGTLFLDEIGDLPLPLQVKLLRVLQEGEVVRLGSRTPRAVDVRLIAATNVDLEAAIRGRHFREDLFYRLKVTSLRLPPLRERPGDILPLARHFISIYERRLGQAGMRLQREAERALLAYAWPGNIRELENTIHHALLVCTNNELTTEDLQLSPALPLSGSFDRHRPTLVPAPPALQSQPPTPELPLAELERVLADLLRRELPDLHDRVEATLIRAAYQQSGHNQLETARLLGISRNVVRARLIQHGALNGRIRRAPETAAAAPAETPSSASPVWALSRKLAG